MTFLFRAGRDIKRPFGAKIALMAIACIAAVCLAGCRPAGPERVAVSGSVSYNGAPIKAGQIRFLPTKETGGPMSGAYIVDGKYEADKKGGVPVGTHRVEITAWHVAVNAQKDAGDLVVGSRGPQYLPPKFNTNSELQVTIESGSGPVTKDFDLRP